MYRSRKDAKRNQKHSCGCEPEVTEQKINSPVSLSQLSQSNKCRTFIKTIGRRHKLCIGQRKNLRHWRKIEETHPHPNKDELNILSEDDQMNIFECDSSDVHINDIQNCDHLLDEQMEIFESEGSANLGQLSIFPPDEEITSEVCDQGIPHEENIVSLKSAKISKNSILEKATRPKKKTKGYINIIGINSDTENLRTVNLSEITHEERKIKKMVNKIINRKMLTGLVMKLEHHNLSKDFLFSLESMSKGEIAIDNIPHLAHLETMRFHRCKDSRHMWYSRKMKKFWHCFYKVGGGPPLRLLSGPKGIGNKNYETSTCNINFAVPSANTIRCVDKSDLAKIIPPSIFTTLINKISQSITSAPKEFILSYDGKSVGTGLKGDNCGDVDLWGFETEPNLKLAENRLNEENIIIDKFNEKFIEANYSDSKEVIEEIVAIMTSRIKDIRKIIDKCKKTELKYTKCDLENPKYKDKHQYTIQGAQYLADNCRAIIRRALNVNRELCEILSYINETHELFNTTGVVHFHDQPNFKILMEPDEISDFFEENDNTVYVKQRTEIWARIREMCAVTGSTMHKALGLSTLQEQKFHYDMKFHGKEPPAPTEEVQKMLKYGTENEVSIK